MSSTATRFVGSADCAACTACTDRGEQRRGQQRQAHPPEPGGRGCAAQCHRPRRIRVLTTARVSVTIHPSFLPVSTS